MVGSDVLDDETLVTLHTLEDSGLLDGPFTNIGPVLLGLGVLLLSVRGSPPGVPVIGELLQERSLDGGGLEARS